MRNLTTRAHVGALTLALALSGLAAPAAAGEVLFSGELDRGQPSAEFERLLAELERQPDDARVPLLLTELSRLRSLVPQGRRTLLARISNLLPRGGHNTDVMLSVVADLYQRSGAREEALRTLAERGFLSRFLAVGPFGIAPNAALQTRFPAEGAANARTLDPRRTFAGWRGEARAWREVKRDPRRAAVSLSEALEGLGQVSYVVTHVRWPEAEATDAALVYRGPSARVWINRALAGSVDRARQRLPGTVRLQVELRPGWNRFVFKLTGGTRASFAAQLLDPTGAPLRLQESVSEDTEVSPREVSEPGPLVGLDELADERDPERRALYAWHLAREGMGEEALLALEAIADDVPAGRLAKVAWFHRLRARLLQGASHLPPEERRGEAKRAYESALLADPASVEARRALAQLDLAEERTIEGTLALEGLLEQEPRDLLTRLRLVAALRGKGWLHAAEETLAAAPEAQRELLPVLMTQLALLESRGEDEGAEGERLRQAIWDSNHGRTDLLLRKVDQAVARRDRRTALAALATWAEASGADAEELALQQRRLFRGLGQGARELAALRAWVAADADSAVRKRILAARLAEEAHRDPKAKAEASELLRAVLEEEPGDHGARQLLSGLTGEEDRFWEEWAPDLEELRTKSPPRGKWPRSDRVCLFDQTVTRIYPDTSSVDVVHQVWRLLDERGTKELSRRPNAGETLAIRTIRPDGSVYEPIRANTGEFRMPGLTPGALVEHSFRRREGAAGFQYSNGPFYFMDPGLAEPFWLSRWVLLIHEDAPVTVIERNLRRRGMKHTQSKRGEWIVHVYEARNMPRVEPEPPSPDRDEFLPWIKVLESRTLDQLDGPYRERTLVGKAPAPSVSAKARELVQGVAGARARALKLLDFVHEHVRDRGNASRPEQVLAARGGSKLNLLLGLLEAAEVPHDLILAGAGPHASKPTDWDHPEPGQFSIPLVRIPAETKDGDPLYLFPFAHRLAPRDQLPFQLWGAPAYACEEGGGAPIVLPRGDLEDEGARARLRLKLAPDGSAEGSVAEEVRRFGSYGFKEQLSRAQDNQLRQFFAQRVGRMFPGANLSDYGLPGVEEQGVPLRWRLKFRAPQVVSRRGDGALVLRGLLTPSQLTPQLGSRQRRIFDLVLESPVLNRQVTEVELGPFACPNPPASVRIAGNLLHFSLQVTQPKPGLLRIERSLLLRPGKVPPARYAAFRKLLRRVDEAEQLNVVVELKK